MKKNLFLLLAAVVIMQGSIVYAETNVATTTNTAVTNTVTATKSMFNNLKETIVNDVKTSVKSNIDSIKLENYNNQLTAKRKELAEVEASSTFPIIKSIKKFFITQKIAELEANIKAIEDAAKTTETK